MVAILCPKTSLADKIVIFAKSHFFKSSYCYGGQARHKDNGPEFLMRNPPIEGILWLL